jgi:hypothetical protein
VKVNRIPGESGRRFLASDAAISWAVLGFRGGEGGLPSLDVSDGAATSSPVITAVHLRANFERQSIVRVTRAGLECHVRMTVPTNSMTRLVVMI